MSVLTTDVCVVGAGPAGSTLATRLAQLGHDVCLIERDPFPRRHLGESLSSGVLPLLEVSVARQLVDGAGFPRVGNVHVQWGRGIEQRTDPSEGGVLVDRGRFDALLRDHAARCGVRILQPARVQRRERGASGWRLVVAADSRSVDVRARFFADATGRSGAYAAQRRATGSRTLALYAYWRAARLPTQPRIEAGPDEWLWGVPIPDGTYNTLVFLDGTRLRARGRNGMADLFHERVRASGLLDECRDPRLASEVVAVDATPYIDEACVHADAIRVGDAALALDPLSSSGVQKAIQTSLAAAVVVNTLLRKPAFEAVAMRFYRDSIARSSAQHAAWASEHYGVVARNHDAPFWNARAQRTDATARPSAPSPPPGAPVPGAPLRLSAEIVRVEVPCIAGDFVAVRPGLEHPNLLEPVVYVGGRPIVPIIEHLVPLIGTRTSGLPPSQIALACAATMPLSSSVAIVRWMIDRGLLLV